MSKCRDLNAEMVANTAKIATALKLKSEDEGTIGKLKEELDSAWKMVETAMGKETQARETIGSLKGEIEELTRLVESGAGIGIIGEDVEKLEKERDSLREQVEMAIEDVKEVREKNEGFEKKVAELTKQLEDGEILISEQKLEVTLRSNELQRESRKRNKLDKEVTNLKKEHEEREKQIDSNRTKLTDQLSINTDLEDQYKQMKIKLERSRKESDIHNMRLTKLQNDYQNQILASDSLAAENQSRLADLKNSEEEVSMLKIQVGQFTKLREHLARKLQGIEDGKSLAEKDRDALKLQLGSLELNLEVLKKNSDLERKKHDELTRERDILSKNLIKACDATDKQVNLVKLYQKQKLTMEQDIRMYMEEAQKQRKIIYQLEKERDRYVNEQQELNQNIIEHLEALKFREIALFDYKKKIAEAQTKLKQQQNLYEACRSDRNLYSKNYMEAQDEIGEKNKKVKIMNHQIDQHREEINIQGQKYKKLEEKLEKTCKEKDGLRAKLQDKGYKMEKCETEIKNCEQKIKDLNEGMKNMGLDKDKLNKELKNVLNERDILGTQLVRRNDELALLYEKIKIQQNTLSKGEIQYRDRIQDIRLIKLEVKKIRREKMVLKKNCGAVDDLRREVFRGNKQLVAEQARVRALEDELENPLNIHRWRGLAASQPEKFELVKKVQALQKRLIRKTEEGIDKDIEIREKEKLYVELKQILMRSPGPEVVEEQSRLQRLLSNRGKQLKRLTSELNMITTQNADYQTEIGKVANDLQETKKKWFQFKKKEQKRREHELMMESHKKAVKNQVYADVGRRKFAGGGFNLTQVGPKVGAIPTEQQS